jgi:hypothetical protein
MRDPDLDLEKEELESVQPRLRGLGWVVGSGFRSPFYPALTLNPSIPGSPTAPAGPLLVVLHPTPPHPTLLSREIGKRGMEYRLEFEEKSGPQHLLLPHYSFLMDGDFVFSFS